MPFWPGRPIIGNAALTHDREFRRLGMVYAAENSLKEMEADTVVKAECDAYTAGVNAYIDNLTESEEPLEYKLIGYHPEHWTNLKTALFLKYMSYDLAGHDDDFEMTNAKSYFSASDFNQLFPLNQDSLDPIIPKGTVYSKPKVIVKAPSNVDSVYFNNKDIADVDEEKPDKDNGSNNWAVSGTKTKSGSPILCNDPHLGLNLPSLWYEMQLSELKDYLERFWHEGDGYIKSSIDHQRGVEWKTKNLDSAVLISVLFANSSRDEDPYSISAPLQLTHVNGSIRPSNVDVHRAECGRYAPKSSGRHR